MRVVVDSLSLQISYLRVCSTSIDCVSDVLRLTPILNRYLVVQIEFSELGDIDLTTT